MPEHLDSGFKKPRAQSPRRSARVALTGAVQLSRSGRESFPVTIFDLSREGCRVEFVERPRLDESVWVKLDGLEPLEAVVCWAEGVAAGLEFSRPIHPAVFDMLVQRAAA